MSFFGFDPSRHNTQAPGFSRPHDPFAGLSSHRPNHGDPVDDDAIDFEDTYDGLGDRLEETGDAFNNDTFGGGADDNNVAGSVGKDFDFFGATAKVSDAIEEENVRYNRQQPAPKAAKPANVVPAAAPTPIMYAPSQSARPARTGYEKYNDPSSLPDLSIDRGLWGMAPQAAPAPAAASPAPASGLAQAPARKMLSLEEVEAQMLAQAKQKQTAQVPTPAPALAAAPGPPPPPPLAELQTQYNHSRGPDQYDAGQDNGHAAFYYGQQQPAQQQHHQHHQQPPQHHQPQQPNMNLDPHSGPGPHSAHAPQAPHTHLPFPGPGYTGPIKILERPQSRHTSVQAHHGPAVGPPPVQNVQPQPAAQIRPVQILQNPNRMPGVGPSSPHPAIPREAAGRAQSSGPHHQQHQHYHVQQQQQMPPPPQHNFMSDEEMAAFMEQEAKRAKRNHKIYLLSRDNGLMTPQDKNFVTRVQLQQLVTATGSPIEPGQDAAQSEDFYYQVYTSIRSTQRQNPNQPLGNFAQTYLFQTGNRQAGRRQGRPAENHVQRMEQQVQRAVEAAKNKPKNPQLVIAGSLGKIAFSNAKTPKPMLSIKRADAGLPEAGAGGAAQRPGSSKRADSQQQQPQSPPQPAPQQPQQQDQAAGIDRKAVLRSIEDVYKTLMEMEDHARLMPAPPLPTGDPDDEYRAEAEFQARQAEWIGTNSHLNATLWEALKVHDPIGATSVHPFIGLISLTKGKKAIPRVFRHATHEQKTTIMTLIVFYLDQLDITTGAHVINGELVMDAAMRENIDMFLSTIMPSLFAHINETPLAIVDGTLGIICRLNVDLIAKSRIGTSMLTMILSRAELIKQLNNDSDSEMRQKWERSFGEFFNMVEPSFPNIFPGSVNSGEDVYVWQFLAAIGVSSNPEQQQRLVLAVKDRVLDTVSHAKTLPPVIGGPRLANVNLFMHSIGLDVDLL